MDWTRDWRVWNEGRETRAEGSFLGRSPFYTGKNLFFFFFFFFVAFEWDPAVMGAFPGNRL